MATKKKTTETEMTPMTDSEAREKELQEALEKMKAERDALLKEVEASKEKKKEPVAKPNADYDPAYWNERVPYELFYDGDRYKDDVSVMVNGKRFLIQRGKKVMIPRYVVHVLENQAKQMKASAEYNRKLQDEFERDTKKYIGE
jgi:hypothetical protein